MLRFMCCSLSFVLFELMIFKIAAASNLFQTTTTAITMIIKRAAKAAPMIFKAFSIVYFMYGVISVKPKIRYPLSFDVLINIAGVPFMPAFAAAF